FLQQVLREESAITARFDQLVESLRAILPAFGERKAIPSWAHRPHPAAAPDGRRDGDADFGRKEYPGARPDGSAGVKVVKWFGYKLHLVVDATYELPVGFTVTTASTADISQALP
ncbi:MAG: transposase, partial [Thermaerobacter sp.]|nr:transposase [Thermaerobacter sp.]